MAQAALARDEADAVANALDKYAAKYPRGRLAGEHDMLRVLLVAQQGRTQDAHRSLQAFRNRYPRNAFLPALEAAVADE